MARLLLSLFICSILVGGISACEADGPISPSLAPTSVSGSTRAPSTPAATPILTISTFLPPTPSYTPLPVVYEHMQGKTFHSLCIEIFPSSIGPYETGVLSISVDDLVPVFGMVGIAVQKSSENCKAHMRIELGERPLSAEYGSQTCYTGALVKGEVSLAFPGAEDLRVLILIDENISPPYMITECPASPLDAPVKTATIQGLLGAFSQIWSYDFLTALIRSQEWWNPFVPLAFWECSNSTTVGKEAVVGCLAAAAMARSPFQFQALKDLQFLGPVAQPAVPELISLLEATDNTTPQFGDLFGNVDIPEEVAETLKIITGQDFGTDAAQWRAWWESQL